jgi:hypothetical protein
LSQPGRSLQFKATAEGLVIEVPTAAPDPIASVIVVER